MERHLRSTIRSLLFSSFLLVTLPGLIAQNVEVSGTVKERSTGITLIGVTVLQRGTTNGTVTDVNGKYRISLPKDSVLVFSYVGFTTQEILVKHEGALNVLMDEEVSTLDELIVIGYSTQKKTDKTGAVSMVKSDELNGGVITDPIQAMQGKVAGVSVSKKGGDPTEGYSVRIRGASGYDANTQPLYVIDGIPNADPTMIASDDIETYNVLKDAASTAIYGSQGSNGVIIITTKKGIPTGKAAGAFSNIEFSTQVSFEKVAKKLDVLSAFQMRRFAYQLLTEAQIKHPEYTMDSVFIDGGASTDWQDQIYRTGVSTSNTLSISGGNEKNSYMGSVNHSYWEGVMKGTSKERTTARINFTHKTWKDRITFTGNLMGAIENNDLENYDGWDKDDVIYQAISRNPTDPVYNKDGSYYKTIRVFNYENPLSIINEITNTRDAKKFLGGLKTDVEFIPGLIGSLNLGYTMEDKTTNYFRPANLYATADNGFAKKQYDNTSNKLIEVTGNYIKTFNVKHNLNALVGYSWQMDEYNGFFAQARDANSPYSGPENLQTLVDVIWGDISSWRGESTLIGFFGRVQYNYASKYYVSASLRRDGSSKFGSNHKWGWFPTAAIGWSMEKENFMHSLRWLNQWKWRVSYGVSGNDKIGEYRSMALWQPFKKTINPETGQYIIAFQPAWNSNPDLKWEETSELNFGADFAFLNEKISGSIEYYIKRTDDLLGQYSVSVPPNQAQTTYANSGSMGSKGIELFLQAYIINKKNIAWKSALTVAHNRTEILDLGDYFTENIRHEGYISGRGMVGTEYWVTGIMVGEETGTFYLPVYVTLTEDGEVVYKSLSGGYTTNLAEAKREIIGTAAPKVEIGWSNNFTFYKHWKLDFSLRAWIGNHVYNATEMFFDYPGNLPSLNGVPSAIDWYNKGRTSSASIADIYVENASFLKLDYIALTYDFDVSKIRWIDQINVFIAANNVFTITGYSGVDPETKTDGLSFGIDQYNVYPKTRAVTVGLKVKF
ncbi:MAG TPA: SusC/RagA family TonB-linked outer membrane protein [Bacteroidales bacterium]|nr:SusC/RagA family TonB-linked outer membrane protein [Bacteroidales bacterium]